MQQPLPPKPKKSKKIYWFLLFLLLAGGSYFFYQKRKTSEALQSQALELVRFQQEKSFLDTLFTVTLYAIDEVAAEQGFVAAFARGERLVEASLGENPQSELSLLNEASALQWIRVSKDLWPLLNQAVDLAELTSGAYDPLLGEEIDSASQGLESKTDWETTKVDFAEGKVMKLEEDLRFDLSDMVKGYIADEMLVALESKGIRVAQVTAGSDARCGQAPPREKGWPVKLRDHFGELTQVLVAAECAVFTSEEHIASEESSPIMATVIAQRGVMADGLATAACAQPDFVSRLPSSTNIHSRILQRGEMTTSKGFPALVPLFEGEEKPASAQESLGD